MSLPYMPFYVSDYEADTAHLKTAEDGALMRLLRLQWRTPGCTLPDDSEWVRRRVRASVDDWQAMYIPIFDEFFVVERGRRFSQRLLREYEKARDLYEKRSAAGRKSGEQHKRLNSRESKDSNASANPQQPEPKPQPEPPLKRGAASQRQTATRLPRDWELPEEWLNWAMAEGLPNEMIVWDAKKFRDHWIAKSGRDALKQDWFATWRNWCRRSLDHNQSQKATKDDGRFERLLHDPDR
ncbi:MAG: DUF1376 domain-containing protein [Pseudomonadota bacterium]